ncbi:MAG: 50S ribosomal protein L10 [Candidatus Borkfalkiaceae bacterium]|nr:50S ribosomal protein L10 [Christensenellaceae bacterium]
MSANLEAKKQIVEEIKAKINASKSVVLIDYKGLTVAEDTKFRCNMRKANVDYKVLKNTLLRKAFNELNVTDFDSDLNGTTSVAFCPDETSGARIACEMCKDTNDKISVKSAYVDGGYVNAAGVKQLASIPSKEVLVAQLAGALSGIVRGLAVALNAVAEKKGENA